MYIPMQYLSLTLIVINYLLTLPESETIPTVIT